MNSTFMTYTGVQVAPLNPTPEMIDARDIAHALAFICRGNGHYKHFYTVAQHCINCVAEARARGLSKKLQLACLLHDGSEAYLGDMVRPLKKHIEEYLEIEEKMQACVYVRFGIDSLTEEEAAALKAIDDAVLYHEFAVIKGHRFDTPEPIVYAALDFEERPQAECEEKFILLLKELTA